MRSYAANPVVTAVVRCYTCCLPLKFQPRDVWPLITGRTAPGGLSNNGSGVRARWHQFTCRFRLPAGSVAIIDRRRRNAHVHEKTPPGIHDSGGPGHLGRSARCETECEACADEQPCAEPSPSCGAVRHCCPGRSRLRKTIGRDVGRQRRAAWLPPVSASLHLQRGWWPGDE